MRQILWGLFALSFLALTSCSKKGFDQNVLKAKIRDTQITSGIISEEDIKNTIDKKKEIATPFKIGIYFEENQSFRVGMYRYFYDWHWTTADKDKILTSIMDLKNKDVISEAVIINEIATNDDKVKKIRLAAAQAGVDKVLIINGIFDMDYYGNGLGFTYVLLLPAFFVPGTISHGLFLVNATLWDLREPTQYFSIETEGMSKQIRPKALLSKSKLIRQSKAIAIENLLKDLNIRIINLKTK